MDLMDEVTYTDWVLDRHPGATLTEAVLGIVSEAGEVAQVKRKHMAALDEQARADMALELGDVLHYLVLAADRLDLSMSDIMHLNIVKLEMRDKGAVHRG